MLQHQGNQEGGTVGRQVALEQIVVMDMEEPAEVALRIFVLVLPLYMLV